MGEPVFLVGTPSEVGRVQGELQRAPLQERVNRVLRRADSSGQLALLHERAERFGEVVQNAAPHWLDESRALCTAANIEVPHLLALNCLPRDFWGRDYVPAPHLNVQSGEVISAFDAQGYEPLMGGDCTTFFALGPATLGGETLLHKNRDERDELQWLGTKQIENRECRIENAEKKASANSQFSIPHSSFNRWVGGADIGHLGIAHLHAEDYWVGANNTGSPVPDAEYQDCALNDGHVLRYLAEHCSGLSELLPALDDLLKRGLLGGGGPNFGMIFLFADAQRGLIVECTAHRISHQWFEGDAMAVRTNHFLLPETQAVALPTPKNSLLRYERARQLWDAHDGYASIAACGEIGRDRENAPQGAIARDVADALGSVTTSSSTATISAHDDRRCQTHFRNCHPSYTPVVILTPLDRVSDSDLVSGAHNAQWRAYRDSFRDEAKAAKPY